jgi:hypothetical protein
MKEFVDKVVDKIIRAVGSVWCILIFAVLAFVSLPAAIATKDVVTIIAWIAQTFLQLVLLAVIQSGQNRQGDQTDHLIKETHDTVMKEVGSIKQTQDAAAEEMRLIHQQQRVARMQYRRHTRNLRVHRAVVAKRRPIHHVVKH